MVAQISVLHEHVNSIGRDLTSRQDQAFITIHLKFSLHAFVEVRVKK